MSLEKIKNLVENSGPNLKIFKNLCTFFQIFPRKIYTTGTAI